MDDPRYRRDDLEPVLLTVLKVLGISALIMLATLGAGVVFLFVVCMRMIR